MALPMIVSFTARLRRARRRRASHARRVAVVIIQC